MKIAMIFAMAISGAAMGGIAWKMHVGTATELSYIVFGFACQLIGLATLIANPTQTTHHAGK